MEGTRMNQTKLGSFYEACINVAIGFGINFGFNLVILPIVGLPRPSMAQNFLMGVLFTVVSVARSYLIRRFFNARLQQLAQRMAGAA
jgi:membrane protein implicated in regulation of membrane protease activity